jgi:hypothetical protein
MGCNYFVSACARCALPTLLGVNKKRDRRTPIPSEFMQNRGRALAPAQKILVVSHFLRHDLAEFVEKLVHRFR